MRTNIVIDDALMKQAMQASGARSKREAVELGLRTLVKLPAGRDPRFPGTPGLGGESGVATPG
jgi:Arc/MetJ family transcription regulator